MPLDPAPARAAARAMVLLLVWRAGSSVLGMLAAGLQLAWLSSGFVPPFGIRMGVTSALVAVELAALALAIHLGARPPPQTAKPPTAAWAGAAALAVVVPFASAGSTLLTWLSTRALASKSSAVLAAWSEQQVSISLLDAGAGTLMTTGALLYAVIRWWRAWKEPPS